MVTNGPPGQSFSVVPAANPAYASQTGPPPKNHFHTYFDEDNGEGRTCDYYTPYTCSQEGEVRFRNPNGEDVQIDEDCCNELGYTFGGNATTGKNACLCETPGEEIDWTVRPGLG